MLGEIISNCGFQTVLQINVTFFCRYPQNGRVARRGSRPFIPTRPPLGAAPPKSVLILITLVPRWLLSCVLLMGHSSTFFFDKELLAPFFRSLLPWGKKAGRGNEENNVVLLQSQSLNESHL